MIIPLPIGFKEALLLSAVSLVLYYWRKNLYRHKPLTHSKTYSKLMNLTEFKPQFISGIISVVIALIATYAVSIAIPTQDLQWALTAVGFASFFSGFFGRHYAE